MSIWKDFNDAAEPMGFGIIPKNTLVKAYMEIKRGGYDDVSQDWTDGYVTRNAKTGSAYLDCKFVVMTGEYAKRQIWHMIGLHSAKSDEWANMGRTFIKSLLNSAKGLQPNDMSDAARQARTTNNGFADLDGINCVIRLGVETDSYDNERNRVSNVVMADDKDYAAMMAEGQITSHSQAGSSAELSWAR